MQSRLKASENANSEPGLPRIVRLCRRLKLTEKETKVMIYTLCCQVGENRTGGFARFGRFVGGGMLFGNDTLAMCKACDVKISEMVTFLNIDREHMKQGIFPDVQQSYLLHSSLSFDEVSCKALVGAPLKSNEFLKIEQTYLADVIAEEAGNEYLRMHEGAPTSPAAAKDGTVPSAGDAEAPPPSGEGIPPVPQVPPEGIPLDVVPPDMKTLTEVGLVVYSRDQADRHFAKKTTSLYMYMYIHCIQR